MAAIRIKVEPESKEVFVIEEQVDLSDMLERFPDKMDRLYLALEQNQTNITIFTATKENSTGQTLREWLRENTPLQMPVA